MTWKNLSAHKIRLLLSALSIVLGVGFLAGVLTFSAGLKTTFDGIIEGSTADALVRPVGTESFTDQNPTTGVVVSPQDVARIAEVPEVARADGSVDGLGLYLLDSDGKLVGATGAPTISFNYTDTPNLAGEPALLLESGEWPTAPGEVALDAGTAERSGYQVGDTVRYLPPSGSETTATAELVGTANFNGGGTAGATLVIFDTVGAQQVFLQGRNAFTSVSLTAADGVSQAELVAAVEPVLPDGFTAVTGDEVVAESQDAVGMFLDVINQFLIVFALVAIVVGAFIIANTFNILVAQRVRELALLRALGASRRQVTTSVLLEALVMSLIAATLGIGLGLGLARGLAGIFRAIGLDIASDALVLNPATVITAYVVGISVTMISAWIPARRAAKIPPVAALREASGAIEEGSLRRRAVIVAVIAGLALAGAVWGLFDAPGNDTAWVGAAAVVWILALASVSPIVGRPVLRFARRIFASVFGATGRLAGENAMRNPRRTGATASALMIGLALVSAIGVLASSLNGSVTELVDEEFTSDFLVQGPAFQSFSTAIGDQIESTEGVAVVSRQQWVMVKIEDRTEYLTGVTANFTDVYDLDLLDGEVDLGPGKMMISEGKAEQFGLEIGDTLQVPLPGGAHMDGQVSGLFEPNAVTAELVFPMETLVAAGLDRRDSDLSVLAAEGVNLSELQERLDQIVAEVPVVAVHDKQSFAESIRAQVNQLLYMIYGLLALAIIIAIIGIVNTLGLSVIERTREIGLLRAIGMARRKVRLMVTLESVAIAVLGAVLGLGLGVVIGVMVQRTLTDQLVVLGVPFGQLVVFLLLAVAVGVLAAVLPAIRAARLKVLDAIATE